MEAINPVLVEDLDPEQSEYQQVRSLLPKSVLEQVDNDVDLTDDDDLAHNPEPCWCLCEQPEGEFPSVRMFQSADGMATRIGALEGKEVAAWGFFGVPLRFTVQDEKSGVRYLLLPGEMEAVLIPLNAREKAKRVDADLVGHLDWQEDGWMGDPTMTEGASESYYTGKMKPAGVDEVPPEVGEEDDDADVPT